MLFNPMLRILFFVEKSARLHVCVCVKDGKKAALHCIALKYANAAYIYALWMAIFEIKTNVSKWYQKGNHSMESINSVQNVNCVSVNGIQRNCVNWIHHLKSVMGRAFNVWSIQNAIIFNANWKECARTHTSILRNRYAIKMSRSTSTFWPI